MAGSGRLGRLLPGALKRLALSWVEPEIERRATLRMAALDDLRDRPFGRDANPRDRRTWDRRETLELALEAWRVNPLARRIVELTSQYVVGGGLAFECEHPYTQHFLREWWNHRLNRMDTRTFEWCEELSRSGELFILLSTDPAGMSYVRAIPAADIAEIETAPNDLEQEICISEKPGVTAESAGGLQEGRRWRVYHPQDDQRDAEGRFETVILHYTINRPVGALHGESDLAPLLKWLSRYANWLEDRARLNRYRNSFLFWVKARFTNGEERLRRQMELNANPPSPGSILVTDESESWEVLAPNLASFEAGEDGLALKKMVASGAGIPMHFIAEPEGSNRTTAEAAGGPTYRRFQQRQRYFVWMIEDLGQAGLYRRKQVDRRIQSEVPLWVNGSDISARDNASLAAAASTIAGALLPLRENGLIDDAELVRMVYLFAGEAPDVEELLERGRKAGPRPFERSGVYQPKGRPAGLKIDPISGEPVNAEE
jgi:hypothetical protein